MENRSQIYPVNNISDVLKWESITVYKERAKEFIQIRDIIAPKTIHIKSNKLECGGYKGESNIPSNETLKSFYHAFRFFYLNREPSNFYKIRNIISEIAIGAHERAYLKSLKYQWKIAETCTHLTSSLHRDISGKEFMDLWFNAHFSHSDIQKRKQLKILNNLLSEELSRSFLFYTVTIAGAPIGLLYKMIDPLVPGNLYVSVPDNFITYD